MSCTAADSTAQLVHVLDGLYCLLGDTLRLLHRGPLVSSFSFQLSCACCWVSECSLTACDVLLISNLPAVACCCCRSEPRLVLHDVVLVIPQQSQIDGVIYWVNAYNSDLEFWRNRWVGQVGQGWGFKPAG